jgi:hypothetical protein
MLNIEQPAAAAKPEAEAAPAAWPPGLLMDGLKAIGIGKGMESLGIRAWGFIEGGFMGRLSGGQHPLPLRGFDARRPNNIRLNQLRLTIDRPYDNTKPVDVGFRVDGLFGGDALLTHSPGLFPRAGHGQTDAWADLTQFYAQTWIKDGRRERPGDHGGQVRHALRRRGHRRHRQRPLLARPAFQLGDSVHAHGRQGELHRQPEPLVLRCGGRGVGSLQR